MGPFLIPSRSRPTVHIARKVPRQIVKMIFDFLGASDQVCFSLSCKYLFACLYSYLETQDVELHQLIPFERRQILVPNAIKQPRIQLLLQLENDRWKYCSECWTLHPVPRRQSRRSILLSALKRRKPSPYCSSCHLFRRQTCPMPCLGEVDICPCLTITFRDKLYLIETCRQARQTQTDGDKYRESDSDLPSFGQNHKALWHKCTFTDHSSAKVKVTTTLRIDEESNSLHVSNLYNFEFSPNHPKKALPSDIETPLMCPHEHTGYWLDKFFDEAGSNYVGWAKDFSSLSSIQYDMGGWGRSKASDVQRSFQLTIARNLGNDKLPYKIWDQHRRR